MISISEELGSKNPTGRDMSHKYDHYVYFSRTRRNIVRYFREYAKEKIQVTGCNGERE